MIERFEIDTEQWAVVPRVPTHEMVMAGYYQQMKYDQRAEMYQAMLAAAPRPEAGQQPEPAAEVIGYMSQRNIDWLKHEGHNASSIRNRPGIEGSIPVYLGKPVLRAVPTSEFDRGALTAIALIIRCHDAESLAFDILNEMGLNGADCSELDECDKKDLSQLIGYRGAKLRGLTRPAEVGNGIS